ncbi:glutamyl-tRNA reductase, partial [Halomonas sp. 707D4]|nr:glutamyl-tRNA reductase [Halomonas sp. 707D4]
EDPAKVVERLAHQLANRFMHQPTLALREAASQENHALLSAAPQVLLPSKPAFDKPAPTAKRQKDDTPA